MLSFQKGSKQVLNSIQCVLDTKNEILNAEDYPSDWTAEMDASLITHDEVFNLKYDSEEINFGPDLTESEKDEIRQVLEKQKNVFMKNRMQIKIGICFHFS
jgi:hypothetical protein